MAINDGIHRNSGIGENHVLQNAEFADATAREAVTTYTSADIDKIVKQVDTNTLWRCIDVVSGVPTWEAIKGGRQLITVFSSANRNIDASWLNNTVFYNYSDVSSSLTFTSAVLDPYETAGQSIEFIFNSPDQTLTLLAEGTNNFLINGVYLTNTFTIDRVCPIRTAKFTKLPGSGYWLVEISLLPMFNNGALSDPAPTGSPFTYTNTDISFNIMQLLISGGTVSNIEMISSRAGTVTIAPSTANPVTILLRYGDSVRVTYTVAPTIVFL